MLDPASIQLPYPEYNLLVIFAQIILLLWFIWALSNFYSALKLRAAVISGNIVSIGGLGKNLLFFDEVNNLHAQFLSSIRQSERISQLKTAFIPYLIKNVNLNESESNPSLQLHLWTACECRLHVILDLNFSSLQTTFRTSHQDRVRLYVRDISSRVIAVENIIRELQLNECSYGVGPSISLSAGDHILNLKINSSPKHGETSTRIFEVKPTTMFGLLIIPTENRSVELTRVNAQSSVDIPNSQTTDRVDENLSPNLVSSTVTSQAAKTVQTPQQSQEALMSSMERGRLGQFSILGAFQRGRMAMSSLFENRAIRTVLYNHRGTPSLLPLDFALHHYVNLKQDGGNTENSDHQKQATPTNRVQALSQTNSLTCVNGILYHQQEIFGMPDPKKGVRMSTGSTSLEVPPVDANLIDIQYQEGSFAGRKGVSKGSESDGEADKDDEGDDNDFDDDDDDNSKCSEQNKKAAVPSPSSPGEVPPSVSSDGSSEADCVVCLSERKQIVLLPCRHFCVCRGCLRHVQTCPVCRAPFVDIISLATHSLNADGWVLKVRHVGSNQPSL